MSVLMVGAASAAPIGSWTDAGEYDISWYSPGGGDSAATPYLINNSSQLAGIAVLTLGLSEDPANYFAGKYFLLTNESADAYNLAEHHWTPIGDYTKEFQGNFDGGNRTISDMNVSIHTDSGYFRGGLFGYVRDATIKNVRLENAVVNVSSTTNPCAGGIAGYLHNSSISNSYVTGTVTATGAQWSYAGGLVGVLDRSSISSSYATGNVITDAITDSYAGGFSGFMRNSTISGSYATGSVHASATAATGSPHSYAGGFVGYLNSGSSIVGCHHTTGEVTASNTGIGTSYAGGVSGYLGSDSSISNSYATGNVTASDAYASCAGGVSGYLDSGISIRDSYATGNITGSSSSTSCAGGFVGCLNSGSSIRDSYATGNVSTSGLIYSYAGGFSGFMRDSTISNSYATGSVHASATAATGFPHLYAGGFVGYLNSGSSIVGCHHTTGEVTASNTGIGTSYAGGVSGYLGSDSSISTSYATGSVRTIDNVLASTFTNSYAGGFTGFLKNGSISTSYATGSVNATASATSHAGGFAGYLDFDNSSISSSYATGNVSTSGIYSSAGGFTGYQLGSTVKNSISLNQYVTLISGSSYIGRVSGYGTPTNSSGWINVSGKIGGGTPFIFIGDAQNGTTVDSTTVWNNSTFFSGIFDNFADNWTMSTVDTYRLPILKWQPFGPDFDASYLKPSSGEIDSPTPTPTLITPTITPPVPNTPPTPPTLSSPPTSAPTVSSSDGNMENALRVLFDSRGGSFVQPATGLSYGDRVPPPTAPIKTGSTFAGWYKDEECTILWIFSEDAVPGDMTLYAKWTSTKSVASMTAAATQTATPQPTMVSGTASATQEATPSPSATPTAVPPTMTEAPAPMFGMLIGLLAAGVLMRRRLP
ncbi:InlB B-repeat-containing protein [Methanorbis rubei]|uniref:InlB B-repeat-containing protein n=1 Tax=Methanorbis rubei TaxID=3028300 RepID=UPI0030B88DB8